MRRPKLAMVLIVALAISGCAPAAVAREAVAPDPHSSSPGSRASAQPAPATATAQPTLASALAMPPGVILAAGRIGRDTEPGATVQELAALVGGNTEFGLDLFHALSEEDRGNLVISPHSLSTALAMTDAGARGETASQMADTLRLSLAEDRVHAGFNALDLTLDSRNRQGVELEVANQTWAAVGQPFEGAFLDTLGRQYGAPMATVDFGGQPEQARKQINAWGAERTRGRVEEVFPRGAIHPNTVLVLANAVYMLAKWKYPLAPAGDGDFTLPDGSTTSVPMMQYDLYLPSAYSDDYQAVELPYTGDQLSMVIIVPTDLEAFEESLDAARLQAVLDGIAEGGIHLTMPTFTLEGHQSLKEPLIALGMRDAFREADFSGMTGDRSLFIDAVEHGTFIQVNEEGTEAAAVSGVAMAGSHGPTVEANRPFLFLIRDRITGAVLFLGRVVDPRG